MSTQPEALRLAEFYEGLAETPPKSPDNSNIRAAAAELRRLSAENKLLHERHHDDNVEYTRVLAQRDALLAVVNKLEYSSDGCIKRYPEESEVNAAIAKAEGQ